jgi:hypothetical protein
MSNFEKGWAMYAKGQRIIKEARGWPKIVRMKIAEGTNLIIAGAKLANTPEE